MNKFLHTLESCWLCLRFPFLYPRNRFTGRHHVNVLHRPLRSLYNKGVLHISITGRLETCVDKLPYECKQSVLRFIGTTVVLDKEKKTLTISNRTDKVVHDLSRLLWTEDKFDIIGISLHFSIMGDPILIAHVKTKDETDKTNYGFHYDRVELTTSKLYRHLYNTLSWIDNEILDRLCFIPTYTELDAMDDGWRKAFGIQMCEEIKAQLKKEKYLYKYRITQIKEKFGRLEWYDEGHSPEVGGIIEKYGEMSYNTCVVCGEPATKITCGWICPYCDEHFPKDRKVHMEKVNGKWKMINKSLGV